jgi:hypothetical protein
VISCWVAFFIRKVVRFLSSAIVYIILPIRKKLVNIRVNTASVLIFGSNRPYVTTYIRKFFFGLVVASENQGL